MDSDKVILEIKTPRNTEETSEAMTQFLSSLVNLKRQIVYFYRRGIPISLEIATFEQRTHFFIVIPQKFQTFIEGQLTAQYPKALIAKNKDYLPDILSSPGELYEGRLKLKHGALFPIKTYKDFKDVDPLSSILGILAKLDKDDKAVIQYLLVPIGTGWQTKGQTAILKSTDPDRENPLNQYKKIITDKISQNGFRTGIRILVKSDNPGLFFNIVNGFSIFNNPIGNSFYLRRPHLWQKDRFERALIKRSRSFIPSNQVLNVSEIASLYHLPTEQLAKIHNLSWTKAIFSEPPENLPIAQGLGDAEKQEINFFANTEFKNKLTNFGIKGKDRRKHTYIIGKTGAGKSTLIANMAINDIRNGEGVAVIDPHGDLTEIILDYIPSNRINDVIYLDPSDSSSSSFHLNPLEVGNTQKELVASGIVSIFKKLYGNSWGPRLEYILRNTILTLLEVPDSTFLEVPGLLTDKSYRDKVVAKLNDPVLKNYWLNEFETMTPRLMSESISPILNKVGQFISSNIVRNIIGAPKSTIDLEKIMNEGKIVLLNLSQGKLGEDNSSLLGAMIITKLQLAAMNRVDLAEEQRKDFYLYVDEFQNFATNSFIKILSEARKYHLDLIMANQYMAQVPEDVRAAIFGNVGSLISFIVGAGDAFYLAKELGERFKEEDLLALGNYQILTKLSIDSITCPPFLAQTLPLPMSKNQNRKTVIRVSKERYSKPTKE
ncbi:MAG TPA: DUF87 domain-containing protein [Patescibacteria group bacterium]|nr:DUF87 domain-containing protein [Patescibacteria group bacterium]